MKLGTVEELLEYLLNKKKTQEKLKADWELRRKYHPDLYSEGGCTFAIRHCEEEITKLNRFIDFAQELHYELL